MAGHALSTLSGVGPDDFECTQTAQNARLKVDGFPLAADKWIELDSNVADGVIEGVSLTLKDVTGPGGVRIGVAMDTESVMKNVRDFVAKINEVRTTIQEMTTIDSSTGEGSVMTGNYGVQMVGRRLTDITSGQGLGFVHFAAAPQRMLWVQSANGLPGRLPSAPRRARGGGR